VTSPAYSSHWIGGEPQHPGHLETEVSPLLLDQVNVVELALVPKVGQLVLGPAGAIELAGPGQQHSGLAEQVETDVAQRHVLLDLWRAGNPLAKPLRVDESVITELQTVCRRNRGPGGVNRILAQRYSTSSGTS